MPVNTDSKKSVIETLEALRGSELDAEELGEIDQWNKGRALMQLVVTPGWNVVLEMLSSYAGNSMHKLASIDPKNKEDVVAEHAVFYAASKIYNLFVEDVQSAIERAKITPGVIKDGLRKVSPAPPESML